MIILRCIMVLIVLLIPLFIGTYCNKDSLAGTYLYGQLILWALFQLIAVPVIQLRLSFNVLFGIYLCCVVTLVIIACIKNRIIIKSLFNIDSSCINAVLILAIVVILLQMCMYIFGQHLDEDDARWIAEANDALVKGRMYLYNPATGDYIGSFRGEMVKDVFSPWAMYIACMSRLTCLSPAIIAHTVYAPLLLALSYMVYNEMSKLLFRGKIEQGIFLLAVAVINLFFNGNVFTQSVFSMVRVWQGKAVVGTVIIPAIFMEFLVIQEEDALKNWMLLSVTGCAACLFSGMGMAISLIMIGVYGLYAIICGRWRHVGYWLLAMAPSVVYGLLYYMLRG